MRGQYDGYRSIDGVAPDSTTETYAALRLEIENWRWAGVPFFIRTGKRLPVTQTELRLVFKHPPQLGFAMYDRSEPNQLVVKLDPSHGDPAARRGAPRRRGRAGTIELDMEFSEEGGEGADAVRGAAARGADRGHDAVHAAGRRRGDMADHAAAARRAAAGAPVRARLVGAEGGGRARRRARQVVRALDRPVSAEQYDVVIVGTGAGGGTLARHLAPSGKRILLLERGDWLPREPENWVARNVFVDNRYVSPDTWYDAKGKPFQPQIHYFVGGATKLYGAALYRLRKEDFGELQHHDGISPAWPISYDELEPYYTKAEQLYEVHGAHGEDPTEPPASAPYPFPAVSHEPRIQQLADDLAKAGYHPFHAPCGVRLNEANLPVQRLRPLHELRRLPLRGARRSRTRRCSASGPRSSTRT